MPLRPRTPAALSQGPLPLPAHAPAELAGRRVSPPRPRISLPQVTLCAVDCVTPQLAAAALVRSSQACQFARRLLLTDAPMAPPPDIEVVRIRPLTSIGAYSDFMLRDLRHHIRTSHVLVVQWDGFVTDAGRWDPAFLAYDYIGARWPWLADGADVGNGGFSLRSRRLLAALADPAFEDRPDEPEDLLICLRNRRLLERRHGIRFAPAAVAERFSYEMGAPRGPTFGFHGCGNLARHLSGEEVIGMAAQVRPATLLSPGFVHLQLFYLLGQDLSTFGRLSRCMAARTDPEAARLAYARALGRDVGEHLVRVARFLQACSGG